MNLELKNTYDDLAGKLTSKQVTKDEVIEILQDLINPYIIRLANKLTSGAISREEAEILLSSLVELKQKIEKD